MLKTTIKTKILALTFALMFFAGIFTGFVPVYGASEDYDVIPLEDHAISDLGLSVYFTYSNITYTVDGTGIDYGGEAGTSARLKIVSTEAVEVKTLTDIRFGVTDSETASRTPGQDFVSNKFKVVGTNQTASSELFEFDYQKQVNNGDKFDYGSMIGTSTDYNTTLVGNMANTVNVTSDYASLNKTLTDLAADYEIEKGYFDGVSNRAKGKYLTSVVGYENFLEGAMADLKGFISFVTGSDVADIRIQNINLTNTYLSMNMSTTMRDFLKDTVDRVISDPEVAGFSNTAVRMKTDFSFSEIPFISKISEGVNSMVASFGTPLRQIGDAVSNIISRPTGVSTRADTTMNLIGPFYKTGLSSAYESRPASVDIQPKLSSAYAAASIDTPLTEDSVGVSTSILDQLSSLDSNLLIVAGIVIILAVVAIVIYRRRGKVGL